MKITGDTQPFGSPGQGWRRSASSECPSSYSALPFGCLHRAVTSCSWGSLASILSQGQTSGLESQRESEPNSLPEASVLDCDPVAA